MVMIMVMMMIMVYVWKPSVWICVIFQKATERPSIPSTNNIVRTGGAYYKCIFLFSLKFSLHNCDVLCRRKAKPYISVLKSWTTTKTAGSNSEVNLNVQWKLGITKDQVTGRICSLYNEVSYYRGSFPYILLLLE